MAPKKKKSAAASSSSQPVPDAPKASRTSGRKRRHSDASNASDRPSSSQSNDAAFGDAPAKRRKRGKAAAEPEEEVIVEEEEELIVQDDTPGQKVACEGDNDEQAEEAIEVSSTSKRVRFGGGLNSENGEGSTATNITPHPRKMTIKRRITMSPSVGSNRNAIASSSRASLPAAFSQEEDDQETSQIIEELQFAPLRAVLDERVRRRLRRSGLSEEMNDIAEHDRRDSRTQKELEELHIRASEYENRIEQLEFELETQRQFAIDVSDETSEEHQKVITMEAELRALKNEAKTHSFLRNDDDEEMLDNDMLVLNSQEEVNYPHLPSPDSTGHTTTTTSTNEYNSQVTTTTVRRERQSIVATAEANWDIERRRFEDAIVALSAEANDYKTKLQILEIELEALGFGGDGVQSITILRSIRQSFASARESLDAALPDIIPENASTEDILEILTVNIESFADRLRVQGQELKEKDALIARLGKQIEGLLGHLTEAEIRKSTLRQQWRDLDESGEQKARDIEDLEEELQFACDERDAVKAERDERNEEVKAMGEEHALMVKNVEKLTISLETYRKEEKKLTELITKMETEHRDVITKMNQEREETVGDLEIRLDTETYQRDAAEKQAADHQSLITEIEIRVTELEAERDNLNQELTTANTDLDAERESREAVESDLADSTREAEEMEARVTRLEEELDALNIELEDLRQANETERTQREAAEADLDDRNAEIEDLNTKLHDQGKEANELRQKLFEVQQTNQAKVKELEDAMSERDIQFQNDIADEVERRNAADELAQVRAASILELETRIEEIELEMRTTLESRDERIAELEEVIQARDDEITDLKADLRAAENDLDNEKSQHEDRVDELEGTLATLRETIIEHEERIVELQQASTDATSLHDSEIDDRNAAIADLNANVATLTATIEELRTAKEGLERRVEDEAEQMLQLQNEKYDEVEALKKIITDKQSKILVVEQKAIEADRTWQEVLLARDNQITEMKTEQTSSEETVEMLTAEITGLQAKMRAYVETSNQRLAALKDAVDHAKEIGDNEAYALNQDGEDMLEQIEKSDILGKIQMKRTTVTKTQTQTQEMQEVRSGASVAEQMLMAPPRRSPKKGKGRKKRVVDSGIGLDAEEEMAM